MKSILIPIKIRFLLCFILFPSILSASPIIPFDSSLTAEEIILTYADLTSKNENIESEDIAHPPIKTTVWGVPNSIIGFYRVRHPEGVSAVKAILLFPTSKGYTPVLIDTLRAPGIGVDIQSVFFANTDKDSEKELCILLTGRMNQNGGTGGELYLVNVYDDIKKPFPARLTYLQDVSEKLDGGCDCTEYGWDNKQGQVDFDNIQGETTARFHDAAGVKAALKKLGY